MEELTHLHVPSPIHESLGVRDVIAAPRTMKSPHVAMEFGCSIVEKPDERRMLM
jgi:hypothetical protein